ncbi:efflux RND transporter periplasmic adaptor subunit [Fulvivirgaceae bacterium PWU4]|uniref:Efflux RND transporter periplasmic adaptor subunit n=1 Tax=Chryseosolibacter histidini TaxID=2782349 RepID=A0AAP2GJ93_9BACT|nr:efflux RND transporter periplasmic adaptor subunit [Chryseosolibacter histidini]MBT1697779.1 efflux RND transporter periplasmic adaptor subunit [Chryseosolibacter histidini]
MAKQKRKDNKLIYWLIGAVAVLLIFIVVGKSAGWIGKPKEMEVELAKAKRATIIEKVSASGTVQPVTEVKIAPEVSGEIIGLLIEEGDSVRKGQPLVRIRPDTWQSQLERAQAGLSQQHANLEQSEANLQRAKATFIRAEQEYKRQEKLWNEKVISEADWQLAKQNFAVAQSDVTSAEQAVEAAKFVIRSTEASLREARENFRKTSVDAPMHGVVSKLIVRNGERVVGTATMAGTEMLRIADLNKMEVRVNVNENDIVRVSVGDTAIIDVDSYSNINKEFKGIVTLIANTAKDKTSADAITEFEVRILILASSYQDLVKEGNKFPFRPGMTASVDIITTRKENVLSVPLAAVTTRNPDDKDGSKEENKGGPQNGNNNNNQNTAQKPAKKADDKIVIFINEKGTAKMVEVKTGISDYDNIEILSGISDSTEVVTGPFLVVSKRLKDGEKIRMAEKKEEKKNGEGK